MHKRFSKPSPANGPGTTVNVYGTIKILALGSLILVPMIVLQLFPADSLHAFVPHPFHMLDLMIGKPSKIKTVIMDQRITIHGYDADTPSQVHKGTAYFHWPKGYRTETLGESAHRIHVVNGEDSLIINDGFSEPNPANVVDLYPDLFYFRTRSNLARRLGRLGVDLATAGPGLWQDRPQWIIGAHYPDDGKSQIWINKENFRPLGWRITSAGKPGYPVWEIHYVNWQQKKGFRYPRRINIYQDDVLVREIEITQVKINSKLAPDLLDIPKLRGQYPIRPVGQSAGQSPDEVKKVIDDFSKMYQQ
jgi:outer membrane lipoprotein-sorting protein